MANYIYFKILKVRNRKYSVINYKTGMSVPGETHHNIMILMVPLKRRFWLPPAGTYIIILHITTCVSETHKSLTAAVYILLLHHTIFFYIVIYYTHEYYDQYMIVCKRFGIYAMIDVMDGARNCIQYLCIYIGIRPTCRWICCGRFAGCLKTARA